MQPGWPTCAEFYHPLRVSDVFLVKEVLVALLDGWTPFRFKKHFSLRSLLLDIISMGIFFQREWSSLRSVIVEVLCNRRSYRSSLSPPNVDAKSNFVHY